jgi:hypothetical protein
MVNKEGTILHKTGHDRGRGRIHDYEIFKNKHTTTRLQVESDLGYMGVQNDFSTTVKYVLPFIRKGRKVNSQMKKRNTIESIPS